MRSKKFKSVLIALFVAVGAFSFVFLNTQLSSSTDLVAVCPVDLFAEEYVLPDARIISELVEIVFRYIPTLFS